jgi:hypothetical protein
MNLLVLDEKGERLHCSNYGDCYSVCDNSVALTDFVNALTGYGKILSDDNLNMIQTTDLRFLIRTRYNFVFAMSTDDNDADIQELDSILLRTIDLFTHFYATMATLGKGDTIDFQEFPKYIINQEILQLNC